jgi:outer membrane biogenesis lipoprotein LolB
MLNLVRPAGSAALILAFAACSDAISGPKNVEEARNLRQAQNISSYTYVGAVAAFAPAGPVSVEVTPRTGYARDCHRHRSGDLD